MRRWLACAALALALPAAAQERIVTLAPHLAELVCAVGACAQLVGVAAYTDAPATAAALPRIGDAQGVNPEAVLALRPTRVLAWDGGTPTATIARLRGLGLRVDMLRVRSLDDIGPALLRLGEELQRPQAAQQAAQAYDVRLAALRLRYASRPRLRAFYQIESGPAYTVNRDSPISAALTLCGADNVFAQLPTLSAAVSAEAVLAADPDVVVFTSDENRAALDAYWARLGSARAADPRRRLQVDGTALTRQSPRVLDGIAALCEGLERIRRDAR